MRQQLGMALMHHGRLSRNFIPLSVQPALHNALEPKVKHVMEVEIAQKYADRPTLWSSLFARMDRSVLQDARFQSAPDQTDQARITNSMLDKPENPVVN